MEAIKIIMKSRITLAITTGLLLPIFLVGPVFAVSDGTNGSTPTTTDTTKTEDTTTTTAEDKPLTTDEKKSMDDRILQRKTEAKLKLTTVEQKRIQTRCKASQTVLLPIGKKIDTIHGNRTKVYTNLTDRLIKLEVKLAAKNVDTAELKSEITVLQNKIKTFDTDLTTYNQLVSDVRKMDCATDPAAFKASLEAARASLVKVHADAADIRAYVKDTIKPTLKAIRDKLGDDKSSSATNESSEGSN